MNRTYKIGRISADRIDQAYLLIDRFAPALDIEAWRTFCCDVMKRDSHQLDVDNVVIATNPLDYVQGLCITALRGRAEDRILDVPVFVVTSAADAAGVAADMLAYLKNVGRAEACGGIRIWTLGKDNWTRHLSESEIRRWDHGAMMILEPNAPLPAETGAFQILHEFGFPVKT